MGSPLEAHNEFNGILFDRVQMFNSDFDASLCDIRNIENPFTIVSYNLLAECHMIPLTDDASDSQRLAYDRDYRHAKFVEEFRYLESDIVCLQEVSPAYFKDYLLGDLNRLGYEGSYQKRIGDTPLTEEGVATFVRKSRFDWLSSQAVILRESAEYDIDQSAVDGATKSKIRDYIFKPDVVLIEQLKCKLTGQKLTLGNTHVTWSEWKVPDVQALQIASAMRELLQRSNDGQTAHILCGDFNQPITFAGYDLAIQGKISKDNMAYLKSFENIPMPTGKNESLFQLLSKSFNHSSKYLKSVYLEVQGKEPDYTVTGKDDVLDYIFYDSSKLQPISVLSLITMDDVPAVHFNTSTPEFHSDHMSLKAAFSFC